MVSHTFGDGDKVVVVDTEDGATGQQAYITHRCEFRESLLRPRTRGFRVDILALPQQATTHFGPLIGEHHARTAARCRQCRR